MALDADVLLAKPAIETMPQLKGKRIGYEPSAVGALMLYKALEVAGLKPNIDHLRADLQSVGGCRKR